MANLIEKAITCDVGDRATKIIQDALGIKSDDVATCSEDLAIRSRTARPHHRRVVADRSTSLMPPSYRSPIPSWPWSPLSLP
jgi:hypothetical protein